jgi:dienelactone hydrolase
VRNYNLGRVELPDQSTFGPLPVRLWGAIGAPTGAGPHPLVVVAHGRHGDNCPIGPGDAEKWPCFRRERRNDLGLRHVVRALAERGMVAVAPDLNGAFTAGWGEPDDRRRWPRIVRRTIREVERDAQMGGARFGIDLLNRVDFAHVGLLGHSISGHHAVRLGDRRPGVVSLFLLAPISLGARLPDLPTAVVLGTCDGDTGREGRAYLKQARRQSQRQRPVFQVLLERANHNYFNRTLSRRRIDDAPLNLKRCRPSRRLRARAQQRWLRHAAADFFAVTLRKARRPAWLRRAGNRPPRRVYGLPVRVRRHAP